MSIIQEKYPGTVCRESKPVFLSPFYYIMCPLEGGFPLHIGTDLFVLLSHNRATIYTHSRPILGQTPQFQTPPRQFQQPPLWEMFQQMMNPFGCPGQMMGNPNHQ